MIEDEEEMPSGNEEKKPLIKKDPSTAVVLEHVGMEYKRFIGFSISQLGPNNLLKGNHIKGLTDSLINDEEVPFVLHIMPGNDRTWRVSPLEQWTQEGSGLAIPYQKEQGKPEHVLPNFFVFPFPVTYKQSHHQDLAIQRLCIDEAIEQLYFYAGLDFAIVAPLRRRSEGSEKKGVFGTSPDRFSHKDSDIRNLSIFMELFQKDNEQYEYAFGAGTDLKFCSRHGSYVEEQLNELEDNLLYKANMESSPHKWAYQKGVEKARNFSRDIEAINAIDWDAYTLSQQKELEARCAWLLNRNYFSFDPSVEKIPSPVIPDHALRQEIALMIKELEETYRRNIEKGVKEADPENQKCQNGIRYLQNSVQVGKDSDLYNDRQGLYRDYAMQISDIFRTMEAAESSGELLPNKVKDLLSKVKKAYPLLPDEPQYNSQFFFVNWIVCLIYMWDKWCYDAAKEKLDAWAAEEEKRKKSSINVLPDKAFYLAITNVRYENIKQNTFFSSTTDRIVSEVGAKLAKDEEFASVLLFLNKEAAIAQINERGYQESAFIVRVEENKEGEFVYNLLNSEGKLLEKNISFGLNNELANENVTRKLNAEIISPFIKNEQKASPMIEALIKQMLGKANTLGM